MARCGKCNVLINEINYLREQNKALTDRLMALANVNAYQAVSHPVIPGEFVGDGQDQYIGFDEYDGKVLLDKDIKL